MRYQRLALIGTAAAFSFGRGRVHGQHLGGGEVVGINDKEHGLGLCGCQCREGGVVTIPMAIVGDPGNPSVGVIQTFGGPKGQFMDHNTPEERETDIHGRR